MGNICSVLKCNEKNDEKKLIEMIISNRKKILSKKSNKNNLTTLSKIYQNPEKLDNSTTFLMEEKELETFNIDILNKYKTDFLNDINNENNLVKYLQELKRSNSPEFDKILLFYFDVLSVKNKIHFTQINDYVSYITKFELLIDGLFNGKDLRDIMNEINCGLLIDRYILFEKNIITISKDGKNLNKLFNENRNDFDEMLNSLLLSERVNTIVTLKNKEVYFEHLINYYIKIFLYDNKKRNKFRYIYKVIKNCLNTIKQKDLFSEEENRLFLIIFFSPIISSSYDLLIDHLVNIPSNILLYKYEYNEKDNILYVKEKDNDNIVIKINKGNLININVLNIQMRIPSIINQILKEDEEQLIIKSIKPEHFQNYNYYTRNQKFWDFNINLMRYIFKSEQ